MATLVEVPNHGTVEFPEGMSNEEISTAIQRNFPDLDPNRPLPASNFPALPDVGPAPEPVPPGSPWSGHMSHILTPERAQETVDAVRGGLALPSAALGAVMEKVVEPAATDIINAGVEMLSLPPEMRVQAGKSVLGEDIFKNQIARRLIAGPLDIIPGGEGAAVDFAQGLTTPGGVATAPLALTKPIQGALAVGALSGMTQSAVSAATAKTAEERGEAIVSAGLQGAMAGVMLKAMAPRTAQAMGAKPPPVPDIGNPIPTAEMLLAMTPEQLTQWKKTTQYGPESPGKIAAQVPDEAVPALTAERDALRQSSLKALTDAASAGDDAAMMKGMQENLKAQTLNEIIEAKRAVSPRTAEDRMMESLRALPEGPEGEAIVIQRDIDAAVESINVEQLDPDHIAGDLVRLVRRANRDPSLRPALNLAFEKVGNAARDQGVDPQKIRGAIMNEMIAIYGQDAPEMAAHYFGQALPEKAKAETLTVPATEEQSSPALAGMGAAVPEEFQKSPQTPTSIKNATVDQERAQRGLPPAVQPARREFGQVWEQTMAKIDQDPGYQDRLINELREKPRALTDSEDAALLHRQVDLQNEYGKATRDLEQAYKSNNPDMAAAAQTRVQMFSDLLFELYEINKKAGTETGRGLNARKMMAYEDFSLARMELERRAANEGEPLTPQQRSEVVKAHEEIKATQKALDERTDKAATEISEAEVTKTVREIVSTTPKTGQKDLAGRMESAKEKLSAKFKESGRSELSPLVQRLARLFVERGIRERDPLVNAVHEVLKGLDPEITRRETADAISGYGQFRQLTKDEVSVKLRDLKGQLQQVAKLEDMQANQPPLKTGIERRVPSTEESRLIRLVNEAKNQFQVPITDEATQLKSSLDMLKTRMRRQIADWEDRIARGDFEKRPKRIIKMDEEANRLSFENAKAKRRWHEALMKDRLARRTIPQKLLGGAGEVLDTARAIMTSLDFSAVLRQGGFVALGHPIRAAKSFPAMFRAFASEAAQHAVDREIMARKNYPLYQQSKLYLAEHGQSLSKMEEAYMSRWAEKIPLVGASQRAYTTFLNKLRADSFDAMANSLSRTGELTPLEANAIANYVNVATGRGNLGMRDNVLVGLNRVFFAPRYVASRFQMLLGQPFMRGNARTRTLIAQEYGRYLAGVAFVYALGKMAGAEVETDPRSSDFGKMRWGETRLDPLSGLAQITTLLSRLGSGETKTLSGKVVPIRGDKVPFGSGNAADVMARFLRTKLAPVPGQVVNILSGRDIVGNEVTAGSVAKNLLTPLAMSDIYKVMKEQGVPEGLALGVLSIFGMGLQTHEEKQTK